ncbi:MAG: GDP-mannose 4,6-dehydratase [Rhodospirillales bacterium]|nr:GDP-mannose 4,6-dehydratase [Rhodospirillales bacterium]
MTWNGKKVLVTGAGGFIGSHLAEQLVSEGAEVRALTHYNGAGRLGWLDESAQAPQMDIVLGDITDPFAVKEYAKGVDVIFHLAALIAIPYSYVAPASYLRTNAEGTLNVLQAARELGTSRVVHTSTSEVYGTAEYVPIDEKHPLKGQSPYSASKIAADKMAESYYRSFDLPVVTVRPFNTFGPRQSARAVIPTIITQALRDGVVKLGSLLPTRDMTLVDDTVNGFLKAGVVEGVEGLTINLGTGHEVSIGQMANMVGEILGHELTIETEGLRKRPEKSEVERLLSNNAYAKEKLGWSPTYSLKEGLERTIKWIEQNQDRFKKDGYVI